MEEEEQGARASASHDPTTGSSHDHPFAFAHASDRKRRRVMNTDYWIRPTLAMAVVASTASSAAGKYPAWTQPVAVPKHACHRQTLLEFNRLDSHEDS